MSTTVLRGYRRLLRVRASLFLGDRKALAESTLAIRTEFERRRHQTDTGTLREALVAMEETEHMLKFGIIRRELDETSGSYKVKIREEQAELLPGIARTIHRLATIYARMGSLEEAMKWFQKSLQMNRKVFGEDSVELAKTLNGLGALHLASREISPREMEEEKKEGDFESAREYFITAERIFREKLGDRHINLALVCENLASMQQESGDWNAALKWYKEVFRIKTAICASLVATHINLGDCLLGLEKYEEAIEEFECALKVKEDEALDAVAYHKLGLLYTTMGKLDMALAQFEASWEIKKSVLGTDHTEVANTLTCMGAIYGKKNLNDKSLAFFNECFRIYNMNSEDAKRDPFVISTVRNINLVKKSMTS